MPVIRVFFLALISVTAATYALIRYYTRRPEPMIVVAPEAADSGEIPAPDLEPEK